MTRRTPRQAGEDLPPGLHVFDPQGHAILVGEPGMDGPRRVVVLCTGGEVTIGPTRVRDPDVVDQFADRLHLVADRMRAYYATHPTRSHKE